MTSSIIAGIAALPEWNLSLLLLLAKATIILLAALGITRSMQRASAGARHLVWLVTLGTLLLVPVLTAWAPMRLAILPATAVTATHLGNPSALRGTARIEVPSSVAMVPDVPERQASGAQSPRTIGGVLTAAQGMSGIQLAIAIWASVVLVIIATLAWAGLAVRRIVRHARLLSSPDWQGPLFEIADRLGLEDAPRLLQSDEAKMPFACGMLAPTIVLPAEAEGWTLDRRRAVLLHELAHVRRHDLLGHTLGRLACAVYWFHPLVWTAAKRLRSESERACDDLALSCGTRATDYAEHLLDIVTSVKGDATPLVALAMARRKEFEGRMLAILDPELRHSTPSRRQSAALIGSLALLSLTVGAIAPVQREAHAAVASPLAQHRNAQPAVKSGMQDAPVTSRVPMRGHAYPDSGVRGASSSSASASASASASESASSAGSMRVSKSTTTRVSDARAEARVEAEVERRAESLHSIISQTQRTGELAIQAIAKAGLQLGLSAASSALEGIVQAAESADRSGDKGGKGAKGSKGPTGATRSMNEPDDRPTLLAKVLKSDPSAELRRIAAWGLQEYTDSPGAEEALATAVRRDADASVREMSAWALGNADDGHAIATSALASALRTDASDKVRATSAWALGSIGEHTSADALTAALGDASADVRMRAAWALGTVEPKTAPRALVALLGDKDRRTRELAVWALFTIEDPATVPALRAALEAEQDKTLQFDMIRALMAMGEQSVDALQGLLQSNDPKVKEKAVRALAGIHGSGPWPWPWPQPRPFP